jgi:hypothetical protein
MKIKYLIFSVVLFVFFNATGQIATIIPSTESVANAAVADRQHWTAFGNPANSAFSEKIEIGIQYENRYFMKEFANRSLNFLLPTKYLNTSLSMSYFGYSYYNHILTGLGFARNFSDHFSLGLQFNYLTTYFAAQNNYRGAFFPQIGANIRLSPVIHLGFSTFNPFQADIKTEYTTTRLPSVFSLGIDYLIGENFVTRLQVDKEISSDYRVAAGFEYDMLQALTLKIGSYHLEYFVPCLGFGTRFGNFSFVLNGELHPRLGLITIASAKYKF